VAQGPQRPHAHEDDIAHYQKIVVALSETIRLMKEIDEVDRSTGLG
jgi:capsule polysaccharide export protein KpsC/LpsZ